MSNKSPIETTPCGVCTGWLRCKAQAIMCWAQARLEFLCERDKDALITLGEQQMFFSDWERFHAEFAGQVISERCMKADYTSRAAFADWLQCATDHGFTPTIEARSASIGALTLTNRVGLLPMAGLTCMCCAGYRAWAALAVGLVLGWLL